MSCEKDDGIITEKEQESVNFKTVLKSEIDDFMKQTKEVTVKSETNFITAISDEINYEDITNSDKKVAVIEAKTKYKNLKSKVVLLKVNNEVQSVVVSLKPFNYSTEASFSGKIVITDVNGVFIKAYKVEENVFISKYIPKNSSKNESKCDETLDPTSTFCYNFLEEVMLTDVTNSPPAPYVSIAHMYPSGGGSDEQSGCEVGCNNSWDPVAGGGGSGSYPIDDEEDRIVNELDDPCANAIFTELENGIYQDHPLKPEVQVAVENGLNLNFSESILSLFNDSQMFNYNVVDGETSGSNASTDLPAYNSESGSFDITTTFNSNYLSNATQLSIARTMIHESVHAYLLYQQRGSTNRNLYNSLINYAENNGYSINDANRLHHEFMHQYVDAMAYSLYEWDTDYGTGGNLGWDYYQAMAFGGLYYEDSTGNIVETDSFIELVPSQQDRLNIRNILIAEQDGENSALGTDCE